MNVTQKDIEEAQKHLGPLVRRMREIRGMTQKELGLSAGYTGVSASVTINRIEKSQALPRLVGLYKIASALKVQPHQLLDPDFVWKQRRA